jgi:hypothetical protein
VSTASPASHARYTTQRGKPGGEFISVTNTIIGLVK